MVMNLPRRVKLIDVGPRDGLAIGNNRQGLHGWGRELELGFAVMQFAEPEGELR